MNSAIDAVLEKLRELFQQEYQRGQQDALRRVVDVMKEPAAGVRAERAGQPGQAGAGKRVDAFVRAAVLPARLSSAC